LWPVRPFRLKPLPVTLTLLRLITTEKTIGKIGGRWSGVVVENSASSTVPARGRQARRTEPSSCSATCPGKAQNEAVPVANGTATHVAVPNTLVLAVVGRQWHWRRGATAGRRRRRRTPAW
jgi:hypothetical protein